MSGVASVETIARRQIDALIRQQPPTWQHPAFLTRKVRAAALTRGDVIADEVTGAALAVVGVGRTFGTVVAYVRDPDSKTPDATAKVRWTPRELVRRAVPSVGMRELLTPAPEAERRGHGTSDQRHERQQERALSGRDGLQQQNHSDHEDDRADDGRDRVPRGISLTDHGSHPTQAPDAAPRRAVHPGSERTTTP